MSWLENLVQDLHYALRTLFRGPAFSLVALLSLALGIGANTAIFSVINAVMLRAMPVDRPGQLVQIQRGGFRAGPGFSYPQFERLRDQNRVFEGVLAASDVRLHARIGSDPEAAKGQYVSSNFYSLLGVRPFIGRTFAPAGSEPDGSPVAVLHYGFWQRVFGGDPSVIGRTLLVNDKQYSIIGVASPGFVGIDTADASDFAVPVETSGEWLTFEVYWIQIVGRLKPGASIRQATANLNTIYGQDLAKVESTRREAERTWIEANSAASGIARVRDRYSKSLFILVAIAGAVLLIACANVANLLLARTAARRKEFGVRLSLGATRSRIISQMMTESMTLCALGGLAGILFARWGSTLLVALISSGQDTINIDAHLDWLVLLFAAAASVLASLMIGLLPAIRATRMHPGVAIRETRAGRLRAVFVVAQVALSLVLVAGAGLFLNTLRNLENNGRWFPPRTCCTSGRSGRRWQDIRIRGCSSFTGHCSIGSANPPAFARPA